MVKGVYLHKSTTMRGIIQWLPIVLMIIFSGLLFYFGSIISLTDRNGILIYYLNLISQSFKELGTWLIVTILMSLLLYLAWIFIKSSLKATALPTLMLSSLRRFPASLKKEAKFFVKYALPTIMSLILLSFLLVYLNQINSVNLQDEVLMDLDFYLTGTHPYFYLVSLSFPGWFYQIVVFSFKELSLIAIIAAIYIFIKNKLTFQEFSASFCLALFLMLPLWLIFPALSPQDRFIDNVYQLPVSPVIAKELKTYNPNHYIQQFLIETRERKEAGKNPYLPTSTMPSAHVAWAILVGYYLFRAKVAAGFIFTPLLVLSVLGTVFLAQHYFIDIVAGTIVSLLAIIIISFLTNSRNFAIKRCQTNK